MRLNNTAAILSADEMQQAKPLLLTPGVYDFEVVSAEEKMSKAGNEMIALRLKVWDKDGKEHYIYDYLLEALAYKLKHFAECTGLLPAIESGSLSADDCEGKCGSVLIKIDKGDATYAEKNSVKDYVVQPKNSDTFEQDDLPF